jgi:hypothetical protein
VKTAIAHNPAQLNFETPKNSRSHSIIYQFPKNRKLKPFQNHYQPTHPDLPIFLLISFGNLPFLGV